MYKIQIELWTFPLFLIIADTYMEYFGKQRFDSIHLKLKLRKGYVHNDSILIIVRTFLKPLFSWQLFSRKI